MPARSLDRLDGSREVFVHTYLHVREDVMCLYGFMETDERDFFELLKGVSGVGPKVAIGILSAYGPADLRRAVLNRDVAVFQSITGIGKKTAERLVLELKDKVGELGARRCRPLAEAAGRQRLLPAGPRGAGQPGLQLRRSGSCPRRRRPRHRRGGTRARGAEKDWNIMSTSE